jgi:RimJ/RimL family protein N-acetyltransferase
LHASDRADEAVGYHATVARIIETARLLLRPIEPDDLDQLAVLHAEESFWWYPLHRGQTRDETAEFIRRALACYETDGFGLQIVVEKETGSVTGWAGLSVPRFLPEVLPAVEVGWRLGEAFRGKGYAVEAGAAAVHYGFTTLDLDRIVSIYEPENVASGRVMDRLGFTLSRVAIDPAHRTELHVKSLSADWWKALLAAGPWPAEQI